MTMSLELPNGLWNLPVEIVSGVWMLVTVFYLDGGGFLLWYNWAVDVPHYCSTVL